MADNFFKEEEEPKQEEQIEKIKLGDKEYTQEELTELVGMGERTREIESTLNTKIDRVYPEFTKATQRNREYEAKIKEYEEAKSRPADLNENSIKEAREAARKIGLVTDDAFTEFMGKHFRTFYQQNREAEKLLEKCDSLETTYNGEDGRPKFKTNEVLQWMADNGAKSPEQAYKMMYEKQLDEWKAKTLGAAKRPGMVTETSTEAGGKTPPPVKVTRDNIDELMREALGQE